MQIVLNRLRTVLANEQLPEQMPANDILLDPQQLATLWARFQFYRVVLLPTGLPLLLNAQRYAQITRSRAVVDAAEYASLQKDYCKFASHCRVEVRSIKEKAEWPIEYHVLAATHGLQPVLEGERGWPFLPGMVFSLVLTAIDSAPEAQPCPALVVSPAEGMAGRDFGPSSRVEFVATHERSMFGYNTIEALMVNRYAAVPDVAALLAAASQTYSYGGRMFCYIDY